MKRLPGTTVNRNVRPKDRLPNRNKWVGGVAWEKTYGATGMWLAPRGQTLSARKSWFCFDDEIVALGSGVSSKDNQVVETIVENRRIKADGSNALTVDGAARPARMGWKETMKGVQWIHLAGSVPGKDPGIGYCFPRSATIKGLRERRTGTWQDVNPCRYTTDRHTNSFLTLWFDHGKNPGNASYAYVLLPNRTAAEVKAYAGKPDIEVVAHSGRVHAVREKKRDLLGANFWTPGPNKAGIITCKGKASVMLGERPNGEMVLAVADPTHAGQRIELEIARKAGKVVSKDREIRVERLAPAIKLSVNVKGTHGKSLTIRFSPAP
jgi:hyaluronate lyase